MELELELELELMERRLSAMKVDFPVSFVWPRCFFFKVLTWSLLYMSSSNAHDLAPISCKPQQHSVGSLPALPRPSSVDLSGPWNREGPTANK